MPTFNKNGELIVEEATSVERVVRRVVSEIRITDILTDNPLITFDQVDQLIVAGLTVFTTSAPAVVVYRNDLGEIPLGDGRTITADQLRFALSAIWAERAEKQQ